MKYNRKMLVAMKAGERIFDQFKPSDAAEAAAALAGIYAARAPKSRRLAVWALSVLNVKLGFDEALKSEKK